MNCILLPAAHFSSTQTGTTAYIDHPEHLAHIKNVLRLQVGDQLKIGQYGGQLGTGVIETITPDRVELGTVQLTCAPPPKLDVTVILALPRPKVLRRLIMDMTALGVRDIILINSYRTEKSYWQSPLLRRLDEFVAEGLQQGVDTIAPRITLQKRFKPFVEDELASWIKHRAIVAHPYDAPSFPEYLQQSASASLPDVLCIGAEGGWIDYEIALFAQQGCQAVSMGPRVLRTEAAVNVLLGRWLLQNPE